MSLGPNSSTGGPCWQTAWATAVHGPCREQFLRAALWKGPGLSGPINLVTGARPYSSVTLKVLTTARPQRSAKPQQELLKDDNALSLWESK